MQWLSLMGTKRNTIRVPAKMKGHIQRHVLDARRSKGLNREYTNWEMTLSIERDKGKVSERMKKRCFKYVLLIP